MHLLHIHLNLQNLKIVDPVLPILAAFGYWTIILGPGSPNLPTGYGLWDFQRGIRPWRVDPGVERTCIMEQPLIYELETRDIPSKILGLLLRNLV